MKVKCDCCKYILDEDVTFVNRTNELGEEISNCEAICGACGKEYEWVDWGHQESIEECKISLSDKFGLETEFSDEEASDKLDELIDLLGI